MSDSKREGIMKTYYVWKMVDNKKVDILKIRTERTKEEVKAQLGNYDYDGIDVVWGCF